jgi:uncharacterized protein (DUF2236 family)
MGAVEGSIAKRAPEWGPLGPGTLTWRVNREAVLLLGGGRALILQVAQPQVAAGVRRFSDYREDPWGRLYRTLDVTLRIVFGDGPTSREAAEQLHRRHERVRGSDDRGQPYRALDPDLLLWVHATLVDTSLLIYQRYVAPLDDSERAGYYEEMKVLGEAYGIPRDRMPADWAAFRAYFERMLRDGLRVTDSLRDVTDAVLRPPLPFVARPVVEMFRLVTVGTLPESLRGELGLSWGPARQRLLDASTVTLRNLMPLLPGLMRYFPPARSAVRQAT